MRRGAILLILCGVACSGGGKQVKQTTSDDPHITSPGLTSLRNRYETFKASKGTADDFDDVRRDVERLRTALPPTGKAEADVILAVAEARMVDDRLENAPDDEDGVLASTVIPLTYGVRMKDGESVAAFRDRLCDGPAKSECAGALPDFWGRALTYGAAVKVGERLGDAPSKCGCDARYREDLVRVHAIADHAGARKDVEKRYWVLEQDPLPRSAFASPTAAVDGTVKTIAVRLDADGGIEISGSAIAAGAAKTRIAAVAAALGTARGDVSPDRMIVAVVAPGAAQAADLATVLTGAASAAYGGVTIAVRQAAPPNYKALLSLALVRGKAPAGVTPVWPAARDTVQALVDKIDTALTAKENAKAAFVVPR
jgi:hypothetical protein